MGVGEFAKVCSKTTMLKFKEAYNNANRRVIILTN